MPVSLPDQIEPPPQTSRPPLTSFLAVALFGLLIGTAVQELRWRWSVMVPKSQLVQAEQEFHAGDKSSGVRLSEQFGATHSRLFSVLSTWREVACFSVDVYRVMALQINAASISWVPLGY